MCWQPFFFLVLEIVGRVPLLETVVGVVREIVSFLFVWRLSANVALNQKNGNRFGGFAQVMFSRKIQLVVSLVCSTRQVANRLGVCLGVDLEIGWVDNSRFRLLGMITHISRWKREGEQFGRCLSVCSDSLPTLGASIAENHIARGRERERERERERDRVPLDPLVSKTKQRCVHDCCPALRRRSDQ